MPENDDQQSGVASDAEQQKTATGFGLTVLGVALLAIGIVQSLKVFLYALVRSLSWPLEGIGVVGLLLGIVLLVVVPIKVTRLIPTAAIWTAVGIWFLACSVEIGLSILWLLPFAEDHRAMLHLMIAVIGLILIGSNGWDKWIIQRLRDIVTIATSWGRAHAKLAVITSFTGLWLVNPYNAHETCLQASRVAENRGAYRTAIVFALVARDTFPTTATCGTCRWGIQDDFTRRIAYLQRKSAGDDSDWSDWESLHERRREADEAPSDLSWNAVSVTKRSTD